jgi:hypothetical protein
MFAQSNVRVGGQFFIAKHLSFYFSFITKTMIELAIFD